MKRSLSKRIVGLVILAVLVGSSSTLVSTAFMIRGFNRQAQQDVAQSAAAVQSRLDGLEAKVQEAALFIAHRPDLAAAVERSDTPYLQQLAQALLKDSSIDVLTIADRNGTVVARGHSGKTGDSVRKQRNVQMALAGKSSSGLEEGSVVKFSMRAGRPVLAGDRVVGTVTCGIDLSSSYDFVDAVKKTFGIECTIFHGDTRVSTTIVKDGQRAVGTRMANPAVTAAVLEKGATFSDVNTILGQDYNTVYWPIRGADERIAGMLFIGKDRRAIVAAQADAIRFALLLVAGILVAMGALAYWIARSIAGPIYRVTQQLHGGTTQVTDAAGQVSDASHGLSTGASAQAAAIEETSASLQQMSASTEQSARNAAQADGLMNTVNRFVTQANTAMGNLVASMQEIASASTETQKIVKTIDEIAFQTNLLALNAAVEAARAGQAGAGFAVVADEVRNLAQRAAEAARTTADLIEGTVKKVQDGSTLVATTHEAFTKVTESADQAAGLLGEIASAAGQQAQGITQVSAAVNDMDQVTQQTAANAEESAAVADQLATQARQMSAMVDELVNVIGARGRGHAAGGRAPRTHQRPPAPTAPTVSSARPGGMRLLTREKPTAA